MEDQKEDFIVILPRLANPLIMASFLSLSPPLKLLQNIICMHLNELKSTNNSIEGRLKQLNCEIGERKGKCIKKHFIIYMRYNLTKRVIQTCYL